MLILFPMEVDGEGDTRTRGVLQDIGMWLENVHADKIEKTGLVSTDIDFYYLSTFSSSRLYRTLIEKCSDMIEK